MTARPIRYQRQVSDRNGKIFYTSIASLSHINKIAGYEAAYGWSWTDSSCNRPRSGSRKHDDRSSLITDENNKQ